MWGDSVEQTYKNIDLFITHTWRTDWHGRDNHKRVSLVNERLNRMGYSTWFDEVSMHGDIKNQMCEGVDYSKCALVFATEEYQRKIDSKGEDNCKFEFDRVLEQKTGKYILVIVMEEKLNNPADWRGKLKDGLGRQIFVSMSGNLNDEHYLQGRLRLVVEHLKAMGVKPSQTKNKCESCVIQKKDGSIHPFFSDGDFCTHCSSVLLKTIEPKNFCANCNHHANGSYCHLCKLHLLNKNNRILEMETQYIQAISLEENYDLDKFDAGAYTARIEKTKKDLQELQSKRDELRASGTDLQISNAEYECKIKTLQEMMDDALQSTPGLTSTVDECIGLLGPSYIEELMRLEDKMRSLELKRKELDACFTKVSKGEQQLRKIEREVSKVASEAVKEGSDEGKSTQQHISSEPLKYFESLIIENEIETLQKMIKSDKNIVELKDESGFNLLMLLAVQHGSIAMIEMLLEAGMEAKTLNYRNESLLHLDLNAEIIMMLCKKLGSILLEIKDTDGLTPFMKAHRKTEILKHFVKQPEEEMNTVKKMYEDVLKK